MSSVPTGSPALILALLFMSVGDTVAALVGQQFGKIKIGDKTIEGFAGAFFSCLAISYFFSCLSYLSSPISSWRLIIYSSKTAFFLFEA